MDAGTVSIRSVFGQDRRLVVPLFQRPYVWTQSLQWEALWEDIRGVAERQEQGLKVRPHFLGAIVLDQQPGPLGKLETRLIIDGQQRLTTIQIILEACVDVCNSLGLDRHQRAFIKLTRNDDPMNSDPDEEFKVWPTQVDRDAFRAVMRSESVEQVGAGLKKRELRSIRKHPIFLGYQYFYTEILSWVRAAENVGGIPGRCAA